MLTSKTKSAFKSLWNVFVGIKMKHLLTLILATLACCNVVAQDVRYYTGSSSNPDPIMRQHEAFMDAFFWYVQDSGMKVEVNVAGKFTAESAASHGNTCQMGIVSSATHDGCDTVTIAIGRGSLINYAYQEEIEPLPDGEAGQVEIFRSTLLIRYKGESCGMERASEHQYTLETYSVKDGSDCVIAEQTTFKYECLHIQNYAKEEQR